METKVLNTIIIDGMDMDIQSIEFKFDRDNFTKLINKCKTILKENPILNTVTVGVYNVTTLQVVEYYNSTANDDEKTNEVEDRIGTEILSVSNYGIYYRGYNKWSSDFLEVDLSELL